MSSSSSSSKMTTPCSPSRTTTTKTTGNLTVTNIAAVSLDNQDILSKWGFDDSKCLNCGKSNADIDGMLMQCGKCKKAYYCSTSCWKAGEEEHMKFCRFEGNVRAPRRMSGFDMKHTEPLTLVTWTNETHSIRFDASYTIDHVKVMAHELTGDDALKPERQRLFHGAQELEKGTLESYGILKGVTLKVEPNLIKVKVKTPTGKKLKLQMKPSDIIGHVKELIQDEEGIPASNQSLSHNGKKLSDDKRTVAECGLGDGTTIVDLCSIPITVKKQQNGGGATAPTTTTTTIELSVQGSSTVNDIKNMIQKKDGMPVADQKLYYAANELANATKTVQELNIRPHATLTLVPAAAKSINVSVEAPNGKVLRMTDINPAVTTVDDVKALVQKDGGGLAPSKQRVFHGDNKVLSTGKSTLDAYKIPTGAILKVRPTTIHVDIETVDKKQTIGLDIDPRATVDKVKDMVEAKTGLAPKKQRLVYKGKELVKNDEKLEDVGVTDGSRLSMLPTSIPVRVETTTGIIVNLELDPRTCIEKLKTMIAPHVKVAANQQNLSCKGTPLKDAAKSLEEYGVVANSVIRVEPDKIQVNIKSNVSGKTHAVEIAPDASMDKLKELIQQKESGLAPARQALSLKGKPLPESGTVAAAGINAGDTVTVDVKTLPIKVKTPDGKTHTIHVEPNDSIDKVKEAITKASGMPANQQRVFLGPREVTKGTVADNGIQAGSTLQVKPTSISVKVQTPDGKTHAVTVKPDDSIDGCKQAIASKTGMPANKQRLFFNDKELSTGKLQDAGVKDGSLLQVKPTSISVKVQQGPNGKITTVDVKPDDSLDALKSKIAKDVGLKPEQQKLSLGNKELTDGRKSLTDCGIKDGSTVLVKPVSMAIKVKTPDGKMCNLSVEPHDTIDSIKSRLDCGIPASEQKLFFNNNELTKGTVEDAKIKDGSVLEVKASTLPITVSDGKKTANLQVKPSDTIDKIKNLVDEHFGMKPAKQLLTLNGKELAQGSKTVDDCAIVAGSKLQVSAKPIPIKVKTPDGATLDLTVQPDDTVNHIKSLVNKHKADLKPEKQRLFYAAKELTNGDRTVDDCEITPGAVLRVEPVQEKFTIHVETPSKKVIDLQPKPSAKIDAIKQLLEDTEGMPKEEQRLTFHANELDNGGMTLQDYGVKSGDTLQLQTFGYSIFALVPSGRILKLFVDENSPIEKIKSLVFKNEGTSPAKQIVRYQDTELDDDNKTLKDYGVPDGATIKIQRVGPAPVLSEEEKRKKRKKCYMWYGRLDCPPREKFKEIVARLPPVCEVTPEDIDLLPWSTGGLALKVREMNELFMNPEDMETSLHGTKYED